MLENDRQSLDVYAHTSTLDGNGMESSQVQALPGGGFSRSSLIRALFLGEGGIGGVPLGSHDILGGGF